MDGFWENVSRYPRYVITVLLGVFLNAIAPLVPILKRPSSAIAVVGILISLIVFTAFTLRAMLGLA